MCKIAKKNWWHPSELLNRLCIPSFVFPGLFRPDAFYRAKRPWRLGFLCVDLLRRFTGARNHLHRLNGPIEEPDK